MHAESVSEVVSSRAGLLWPSGYHTWAVARGGSSSSNDAIIIMFGRRMRFEGVNKNKNVYSV